MMNRHSPLVHRIVAVIVLVGAFAIMASVFSPQRIRAGHNDRQSGTRGQNVNHSLSQHDSFGGAHQSLRSMGSLVSNNCTIQIFATASGPRYTIHDAGDGRELGTLLSAEEVHDQFPHLQLPGLDFSAPSDLMLTDPDSTGLHE